ncbi:MAG: ABC transporter ATP-binding protein/permease [Pseudomonadales bacterium]|nr:ABC transporter ATP-binding protein/permease [Pseudomonadales bacterium]
MSEINSFVTAETVSEKQNNIATLARFIGSLRLLRKVLPPTLLVILLAAATPPYFLWFTGELVRCGATESCSVTHSLFSWEIVLPATTATLLQLVILAMACRVGAWMLFELTGQWSTQYIQADMMRSVSGVRTTFFDENPSGRLINRLIGDYSMLRLEGVMSIGDTVNGFAEVLCVGLLIMLANPIAGALIIPVVLLYGAFQAQLAPMMSHARELRAVRVGEALHRETDLIEGRTIFALYGKHQNLLSRIRRAFGESLDIQLFYCSLTSWGMLWMGAISATYAIVVYSFLVYGIHTGAVTTTLAAVIITAVFNLNNQFFSLAWDLSFMGETASHARRAFYMIDLPDQSTEESALPGFVTPRTAADADSWLQGDITFDDYAMSYRADSPRILEHLTMTIPAGMKVGIVGRTGAGKSSLMQALFRMVYHQAGDICIGGRSVFSLEVDQLRRHFGVVPQDPYLFSGTIRMNLTAGVSGITDEKLAAALRTVGLAVELDASVQEGGKDYSVGERQLLCLARLILLDKPFVLMDEPTSALDRETDEKVQRLLRTELANKTVITIAHRLESLEHYDLILELADGRLIRQGKPAELMPDLRQRYAEVPDTALQE